VSFWDEMRAGANSTVEALQSTTLRIVRSTTVLQDPEDEYTPAVDPTNEQYDLAVVVTGVTKEYVDNELVIGSDKMIIADAYASLVGEDGNAAPALFEHSIKDNYVLGGITQRVKKIERIPADGPAVMFLVFIAG